MSSNAYFNSVLQLNNAIQKQKQEEQERYMNEMMDNLNLYENSYLPSVQNQPVQNPKQLIQLQQPRKQYTVGGFISNLGRNAMQVGTGLVNVFTHPEQFGETVGSALATAYKEPDKILPTAWNMMVEPYGLTTDNLAKTLSGKQSVGQLLSQVGDSIYNRPFEVLLDIVPFAGKAIGKVSKATKAGGMVEDALNVGNATVRREAQKLIDKSAKLNKVDRNKLAEAIEYAETGRKVPDGYDKSVMKALDEYSRDYQALVEKFAPDQFIDPKVMAITQKYARDNGISYQQASKELTPYFDNENVFVKGKEFDPNDINNYRLATKEEIVDKIKNQGYSVETSKYKAGESFTKGLDDGTHKIVTQQKGAMYPESKRVVFAKDADLGTYFHEYMHILNNEKIGAVTDATRKYHEMAPKQMAKYGRGELDIADMPEPLREEFLVKKARKVAESKTRELLPEGRNFLEFDGSKTAKAILEGEDLYNKGWIKPVPHGLAEVSKNVVADVAERVMAGRFSDRIFGNASYADIAKELTKPQGWLDSQLKNMVERTISNELLNNKTLGGVAVDLGDAKNTVFVPRNALESGDLSKIKGSVSKNRALDTDIAIDKRIVDELDKQSSILRSSNPFKDPVLRDAYNLSKSSMLASGGYLVGNLQTGLTNTLLNAGINPIGLISDMASAVATKGKLAKELGVYRPLTKNTREYTTPVLKQIGKLNAPVSDFMSAIDGRIQNFFAETASHTNLRRKGVPFNDRANALGSMDNQKLADIIRDVKKVSLMNSTNTILPKALHGVAGLTNPYWRWVDTAAQSSLYMLQKSPVMANYLLVDTLANIGIDNELQNRLNLGVQSNKPFVSYRYNPRSRQMEEVSSEFVPMMNTLKVGATITKLLSGKGTIEDFQSVVGTSIPAISAISMAFAGKNKYGKPILRSHRGLQDAMVIQGDKRYTMIDGRWQEDKRFHPDEPVSAAIRELVGWVPLYNRTLAPIASSIISGATGSNHTYYKPYDNAIFGQFNVNPYNNTGNTLFYGSPRRGVGGEDIKDLFLGQYATNYYPERPMLPRQMINLQKNAGRQLIKDLMDVQNFGGLE